MPAEFTTDPEINRSIVRIVDQAVQLGMLEPDMDSRVALGMDLSACHANGCPLDFAKLEQFGGFEFAHDISGIRNHLDRTTGKLDKRFLPRCAVPQNAL